MKDDLVRLERYYNQRALQENYWQDFNLYPYYLSQTQYKMLIRILKDTGFSSDKVLSGKFILDIGAGAGSFIFSLLRLGADIKKITAVELVEARFAKLAENLGNANLFHGNYLDFEPAHKFDIITIMAVLSSITDDNINEEIVEKAYSELAEDGALIIYDYEKFNPVQKVPDYKPVSFAKIISRLNIDRTKYRIYSRVYINARIGKGLCCLGCGFLIPFLEFFKIFNDDYSFLVIRK